MNKKVYLVIGEGFDWGDRIKWIVTGYSEESKAKEHCKLCNDWLKVNHKYDDGENFTYKTKEVPNPYDKDFPQTNDLAYTYSVEEVEIIDHLNTYLGED